MTSRLRARTVTANRLQFGVLEAGSGPLALCLHGFPDSARTWRYLLPALADAGFHPVAPFMRGYAPTEIPEDGCFGLGALVADTAGLHDVLGGDDRAVLIGSDWGAEVAYYRIGEDRRRDAVDKVTAMAFDRHGNRIWRDVRDLLDAEHARYAISEVAVPYGRCTEPSNVQAGGGACPIRFRCAGCDHFRTDVSYLPDLTAYLDDLLRTRERLAAAIDGVDDWARADATPAQEEITRIRALISRIKGDLAGLSDTEKTAIDDAVAAVRKHRAVTLGIPARRPPASAATTATEATA